MTLPIISLKSQCDKRIRAGHLWIYSNEVDTTKTPLVNFTAGCQAILVNCKDKPLGIVVMSPHNLICARMISRDITHTLDKSLLVHRINIALSLRSTVFSKPFYRVVFGDADLLPGLIIDRFGDKVVIQMNSSAMEQHRAEIIDAVIKTLNPTGILLKNDSNSRADENLENYVEIVHGTINEWEPLEENNTKFEAPLISGQKTGWFYDHRFNRKAIIPYVQNKSVLDLFSYIGGWGIQAAVHGAKEVTCIDSSSFAVDGVERNAALNNVQNKVNTITSDVFEALKNLKNDNTKFDVIITDPPAFIKKRKDFRNGLAAYHRLNEYAVRLLNKDGILVSASCSMHLPEDELVNVVQQSARHNDRFIQICERGGQGPDHPIHPAIPETRYIKSLICRVLPN